MHPHDFSRRQEPNEEEVAEAEAEEDSGTGAGEDYEPTSMSPCCLSALTFVGRHGHPSGGYCRPGGPGASVAPMSDCVFLYCWFLWDMDRMTPE